MAEVSQVIPPLALRAPVTVVSPVTNKLPAESIIILSVTELALSAVVQNTISPGISLSPGVPLTLAKILAAGA